MRSRDACDDRAAPGAKRLRAGTLGLISGVVIGLASTAPAHSLAASLGFTWCWRGGPGSAS